MNKKIFRRARWNFSVTILIAFGIAFIPSPSVFARPHAQPQWASPNGPTVLRSTSDGQLRHVSSFHSRSYLGIASERVAHDFIAKHKNILGMPDSVLDLRLKQTVSLGSGKVIRLAQQYQGYPVYGAQLVLGMNGEGQIYLANSGLRSLQGVLPRPVLSEAQAQSIVTAKGAIPGYTRLMVVPLGPSIRLCYVISGRTISPLGVWDYWVDAVSGEIIGRRNTLSSVKAKVYQNSPTQSAELVEVELTHLLDSKELNGDFTDVYSALQLYGTPNVKLYRYAQPQADGNFIFAPEDSPTFNDPFAEVQAYYHVTHIHQWFAEHFGFKRAERQAITVWANGVIAYSDGTLLPDTRATSGDFDGDGHKEIFLGQTAMVDTAYDASVIYHEFTHSVVDEGPKLDFVYSDQYGLVIDPLALNEAFADYFSCTLTGVPYIGEYLAPVFGKTKFLRSLIDLPDEHLTCTKDLKGEEHEDSMIFSRSLWDIRQALGAAKADQYIYETMQNLTETSTFVEAAATLLAVVKESSKAEDIKAVETILNDRGLKDCPRVLELQPGVGRPGVIWGHAKFDHAKPLPNAFQYVIDVPADARALTLTLEITGGSKADADVVLVPLLRQDQPVEMFEFGEYMYDVAGSTATWTRPDISLTLTKESSFHSLVPGARYYLLVTNSGQDLATFNIKAQITQDMSAAAKADNAAGGFAATSDEPRSQSLGCSFNPGSHSCSGLSFIFLCGIWVLVVLFQRRSRETSLTD